MQRREAETLAPYATRSSDTRGRVHEEPEHTFRLPFQRDRDRIVHSSAFRRLEYKTQVFVNHEGDYYRTRLTHSIEAAQITRTLCRALGLNEDVGEAVALSHDLGHTPFGHAGERVLNRLMEEHGGFEHNAQSLRIVDVLEEHYPDFPGLNLSWEIREGIVKHSSEYDRPLVQQFEPAVKPVLEAQIVDYADEIAYNCHDIDDGLKSAMLMPADLAEVELWVEANEWVTRRHPHASASVQRYQTVRRIIDRLATDMIDSDPRAYRGARRPQPRRRPPLPRPPRRLQPGDGGPQPPPEARAAGAPLQPLPRHPHGDEGAEDHDRPVSHVHGGAPADAAPHPPKDRDRRAQGPRRRRLHCRHDRSLRPRRVQEALRSLRASIIMKKVLDLLIHLDDHKHDKLGRLFVDSLDDREMRRELREYLGAKVTVKQMALTAIGCVSRSSCRTSRTKATTSFAWRATSPVAPAPRRRSASSRRPSKIFPLNGSALKGLGRACYGRADYTNAASFFVRANEVLREDGEALRALGTISLRAGREATAITYFERAVHANPKDEAAGQALNQLRERVAGRFKAAADAAPAAAAPARVSVAARPATRARER